MDLAGKNAHSAHLLRAGNDAVAAAGAIIRSGGLVAFATETVYGLGADATNAAAVARIFAAKGRPSHNPLIVHVEGLTQAEEYAELGEAARALAAAFWPGPLTIVAPLGKDARLAGAVTAGLPTVALRAPAHPTAQALLRAADRPIAAPSANRSGHVSATAAEHVAADLRDAVDMILDSGPCPGGLESSIVSVAGEPALLRPGAIPREALEAVCGPLADAGETVQAPGMLASHYAPAARLRLNADVAQPGEAHLGFGGVAGDLNLSPRGDLAEAAANLFAYLRRLDVGGARAIAVAPIPAHGLGEAINDRLRRAAAPRGLHD
ncbi:MAG: L-threonylcarbamoyladenylate synthase [Hyphomicrobiales bacterium]|nr:L-threonylcarbamoyladenylate synthase [Hyphomicrobiales bacterium]